LPLLHRLFSIFLFQAVLTLTLAPPTFSFSFSGGDNSPSCTAYFLFFLFKRCYLSSLHRLLSLFLFQAVSLATPSPPTFSFSFSGGATPPSCTAYFLFFFFRRCYTSLLHRLLPSFLFQAVLHLPLAPPIFSFSFSGGVPCHSCTAYFLFFFFKRCFLSPLHRLLPSFLFQAVLHLPLAPPIFSFSFSGGSSSHSCTAYFLFFLFRRFFLSLLHLLLSLVPFQAVLPLTLAPPTFFFSFSGGATPPSCTAYFLFFLFRRFYTSILFSRCTKTLHPVLFFLTNASHTTEKNLPCHSTREVP